MKIVLSKIKEIISFPAKPAQLIIILLIILAAGLVLGGINHNISAGFVFFILLMFVLLAVATFFTQKAHRREIESKAARHDLKYQITERHRASEELTANEKSSRGLIEKSLGFICTHSLDGTLLSLNPAAAGALGYEPEQIVGRKLIDFVSPATRAYYKKYLQLINERQEFSGILHVICRSGEERVWAFNNTLYHENGREPYVLGTAFDITERSQMEKELKEARNAALESSRIKSEFLANMSHEIRTPMNGVLGMTELLAETALNERQREYVETIRKSGESLLSIINDILDFSKMEVGQLRFEKIDFDLRQTVENAVELFADQAAAKGIELASLVYSDVEVALRGDPGRLRQILTNLVGNAIKFTESGEIIVRVLKEKETAKKTVLRFIVSDTGIGIKPEARGTLFQAFTQADGSITRRFGGTGLGLTISKQLIEMMNGEIGVESEVGQGTTFTFTATFEKQPVKTRVGSAPVPPDLKGLRILVVDDNATNRNILLHQIGSKEMRADQAADGKTALELMRAAAAEGKPYDLILLDLVMPETDGFNLAGSIRRDESIKNARIILMPSYGRRGHASAAKKVSIDGYLTKPIKQADLFDGISAVTAGGQVPEIPTSSASKRLVTRHTIKENRFYQKELILIVEDNPVNQRLIKLQLERLGYRADVVANGLEALAILEKNTYSLILMDCQMPEMDGYAATREIRGSEKNDRHLPIVAITANVMEGEFDKCLSAGMDDYLAKPFSQKDLARVLGKWLGEDSPTDAKEKKTGRKNSSSNAPAGRHRIGRIGETIRTRLSALRSEVGHQVVSEIVSLFVQDSAVRLENLKNSVARKDLPLVKTEAHGLKGSCANVGAAYFADLFLQIEKEAEAGNQKKITSALKRAESNFPALIVELEQAAGEDG